jgi:hypothetical protein
LADERIAWCQCLDGCPGDGGLNGGCDATEAADFAASFAGRYARATLDGWRRKDCGRLDGGGLDEGIEGGRVQGGGGCVHGLDCAGVSCSTQARPAIQCLDGRPG